MSCLLWVSSLFCVLWIILYCVDCFMSRRILLVSDYDYPLWGVEQYVHTTQQILQSHGDQVSILGIDARGMVKYRRFRLVLFVWAWFNIIFTIRLLLHIMFVRPDLIYRHNIHRACGPLPVLCAYLCGIKWCIMYHDLWYFCMYPSLVKEESDIDLTFSAPKIDSSTWALQSCAMYLKYFYLTYLHLVMVHCISIHMVPSAYMIPYVHHVVGVPSDHIFTLPHCLWSHW